MKNLTFAEYVICGVISIPISMGLSVLVLSILGWV